jgi:hypothetical protein
MFPQWAFHFRKNRKTAVPIIVNERIGLDFSCAFGVIRLYVGKPATDSYYGMVFNRPRAHSEEFLPARNMHSAGSRIKKIAVLEIIEALPRFLLI